MDIFWTEESGTKWTEDQRRYDDQPTAVILSSHLIQLSQQHRHHHRRRHRLR